MERCTVAMCEDNGGGEGGREGRGTPRETTHARISARSTPSPAVTVRYVECHIRELALLVSHAAHDRKVRGTFPGKISKISPPRNVRGGKTPSER